MTAGSETLRAWLLSDDGKTFTAMTSCQGGWGFWAVPFSVEMARPSTLAVFNEFT